MDRKLVLQIREWLGPQGIEFFRGVKEKHGRIDATWSEDFPDAYEETALAAQVRVARGTTRIPHSVHFREGMKVRNKIRSLRPRKYSDHTLDDIWVDVVEEAIKEDFAEREGFLKRLLKRFTSLF